MVMSKLKYFVIILLPLVLTGCWDSVEINKRHVILEVAIDKNDQTKEKLTNGQGKKYEVTYTIPDIAKLSGEDSLAEDVKTVIVSKSPSLATSIDEVEHKTQNTLTFSHTKAIILGEDLLKDKELFEATIDGLLRDMQISRGTTILVAKGKAGEITKASNPENPIIGLYIMRYFNNSERSTSYAKQQTLGNMIKDLQNTGITTIPIISQEGGKEGKEGTVLIQGAAVVDDYRFVSWLDKDQVRGELFVDGKIKEVPIIVKYKGQDLTYKIKNQTSKTYFDNKNGEWTANLDINVDGNITEFTFLSPNILFNEENIKEISTLIQKEIINQVQKCIDYSKKINIDFLNIGLEMYRKYPIEWEKYQDKWEVSAYRDTPIKINATVTIHNTGALK